MAAPFSSQNVWAKSRDWEDRKDTIYHLYCELNKPLKEVMKIMREYHGFHGSVKMFKARFKQWGFRKNLTPKESLDVQHQLATGRPVQLPMKNGRMLGSKRLLSVIARPDDSPKSPKTPAAKAIQVLRSAAPKYIKPPDVVYIPEKVLQAVFPMSENGFETWLCGTASNEQQAEIRAWGNQMHLVANMIGQRRELAANFQIFNTCCEKYHSILRLQKQKAGANNQFLIWVTYIVIILLCNAGTDLADSFVRYIAGICAVELGSNHLVTMLWRNLLKMGVGLSRTAIMAPMREQLMTLVCKVSSGKTLLSGSVVSSMSMMTELNVRQAPPCDLDTFMDHVKSMQASLGPDRRSMGVKIDQACLVVSTMLGGLIKERHSMAMLREIEDWYGIGKGIRTDTGLVDYSGPMMVDFHQVRGVLQETLGWYSNAEASFRLAFTVALEQKTHNLSRLLWICSSSEDFYRRRGDVESAETMRRRYLEELQAHINESQIRNIS